jgi:tRNA(adenine34) deaminase
MWDTINKTWQIVFELAWEAFINGSIPIGAAIIDEDNNIISFGRNRLYEGNLHPKIAHAEMEALLNLDFAKYPSYANILYTTMEPCPMCFGTIVMSNIRTIQIAARDGYCGAVHYREKIPYIASKNIKADFDMGILETVQLTMQSYFEFKMSRGEMNRITEIFEKDNPNAVKIAKAFYEGKLLDEYAARKIPFGEIFNAIINK